MRLERYRAKRHCLTGVWCVCTAGSWCMPIFVYGILLGTLGFFLGTALTTDWPPAVMCARPNSPQVCVQHHQLHKSLCAFLRTP